VHIENSGPRDPTRGNAASFGDANAIETIHQIEEAGRDVGQREVRPQRFFIERVQRGALLLGVVGHGPQGARSGRVRSLQRAAELRQFLIFFAESAAPS